MTLTFLSRPSSKHVLPNHPEENQKGNRNQYYTRERLQVKAPVVIRPVKVSRRPDHVPRKLRIKHSRHRQTANHDQRDQQNAENRFREIEPTVLAVYQAVSYTHLTLPTSDLV